MRAHVEGADAVVVSTAVAPDNPEIAAARERGVPIVPRALMLAELMRLKTGIAVAGTHGKTTTTSLIASVLAEGDLDPTFVIGGRLLSADANARLGKGDFLVAEADESDASFLYLSPALAVITNIDADHMETYGHDFGRLKRAFVDFALRLPFYGVVVLCVDDANVREIAPQIAKPIVTYGLAADAQLRAIDVANAAGRMRFVARAARSAGSRRSSSISRACTTCATRSPRSRSGARSASPDAAIAKALAEFRGVGRRFQRYGDVALADGGAYTLIDDYGHHPVEMAATIDAARGSFPGRRLVLAFQPHRYTRTRDLFEDFVKVLSTVDVLVLVDVYPAGEPPIVAADGRALVRAVRVAGQVEPVFVETLADVAAAIARHRSRRRRRRDDGRRLHRPGARATGGRMMMNEPRQFASLRGTLTRGAPLARYTTWRCGGPADQLYVPADRDDLAAFLRQLPPDEPRHRARARQQHARSRRRRARHRSSSCTTPAPRSRWQTASSMRRRPSPVPRSRASPRIARAARARSSSPAFRAPSAARSR